MKIRIVASKPDTNDIDITHLIGREFEAVKRNENAVTIRGGEYDGNWIYDDEYEVVL